MPKVESTNSIEAPVLPETARTGSNMIASPQPQKVFTQAEVKKFYQDKVKGKFRGTSEEWIKLEQEIMDAAQTGRII